MKSSRREFLKQSALVAAAVALPTGCQTNPAPSDAANHPDATLADGYGPPPIVGHSNGIPQRTLGNTGQQVSILGFGGAGKIESTDTDAAVELIHAAHDAGINYFDTARLYKQGQSERNYAVALADLPRDSYYLNTKTFSRDFDGAQRDIEESLDALNLDFVDCVMVHGVDSRESVEKTFGKGGAIHALHAAKELGLTRFIGVSGHANPESLEAALAAYPFDVTMMAISPSDHRLYPLEKRCYVDACNKGIGVINMKTFGGIGGRTLATKGGLFEPEELLRYSWSLRGHTSVVNINSHADLTSCVAAARQFQPITRTEKSEMERRNNQIDIKQCMNFRAPYDTNA